MCRYVLILSIIAAIVLPPSIGQSQSLWSHLKSGDHAIGYRIVDKYDYTRTYLNGDKYGPRPMQISVWYPAEATNLAPMTLGDYSALFSTEESLGEATEVQKTNALRIYRPYFSSDEALDAAYKQPLRGVRNADPLAGSFPVVLYGPSQGGSPDDNAVLCEYLASHGYIVASVASKGAYGRKMPMNAEGVEAQVRDMEFLAGFMHDYPHANTDQLSAVGFSLGGLSNVIFAIRYVEVDAVVSFDGTIGSSIGYDILNSYPYIGKDGLRAPFINFGGDKFDETQFPFYNDIQFADAFVFKSSRQNHLQFSSFNLMFSETPVAIMTAYKTLCEYTLGFLDHYVQDRTPAFEQTTESYPKDLFSAYMHKKAQPKPPSEVAFFAIIKNMGADKGVETYWRVKKDFPDYIMFDYMSFRDVGWLMVQEGKYTDAIKMFELLVDAYPDNADSYRRLGEVHMLNDNPTEAIIHLRKALVINPEYSAVHQMLRRLGAE